MTGQRSYDALPPLSAIYLEDSFVLNISSGDRWVTFDLDIVLTKAHPAYRNPRPGEEYCYRRGRVSIVDADSVCWLRRTIQPFRDASGEVDYGSIDVWSLDGGTSHIEGDWGELRVQGGRVQVALEDDDDQAHEDGRLA